MIHRLSILLGVLFITAAAFPATAQKLQPIKVGLPGLSIGYAPWYYAKATGLFEKNGLEATFVFLSDDTLPTALESKGIQATPLTGSITSGALAGFKVKSVGLLMAKLPWMIIGKDEIKNVTGLKGRQIITSPPKAAPNLLLSYFLVKAGLDPEKDVELLHIGAVAARQSLMQAGRADAIMDDVKSGLLLMSEMKGLHLLVNASEMPNQVGTGLGVADALIANDPELIKRMLRALAQSEAAIRRDPKQAAPVLAEQLKMPPAISEQATKILITAFGDHLVPSDDVYANEAKLRSLAGKKVSAEQIKATWDTRIAAEIDREISGK